MKPWTRQRLARWQRRYLVVDSGKYAGRLIRKPRWQWGAFQASLWLAWRFRWWSGLVDLAFYFCRPEWVGMGDMTWDPWPRWWTRWRTRNDETPF